MNKYNYNTYKFNKFVEKKLPLIVLGLSGSGKTHISKLLSKYYSCDYINEDSIIRKMFNRKFRRDINNTSKIGDFVETIIQDRTCYVYDGIFIGYYLKDRLYTLNNFSFLIMNTDLITSSLNALNRKKITNEDKKKNTYNIILNRNSITKYQILDFFNGLLAEYKDYFNECKNNK